MEVEGRGGWLAGSALFLKLALGFLFFREFKGFFF
jgi:hypothetical protein